MKYLYIVCALMLIIAIGDMPMGYYTLLRLVITIGAILAFWDELQEGTSFWLFAFGGVALLFNPLIPIYLHSKEIWVIIDLIVAVFFGLKAYRYQKYKSSSSHNIN